MEQTMTMAIQALNKPITARVTVLDNGLVVLLTGGDLSHVGAVSYAGGEEQKSFCLAGHREEEVSQAWAKRLWEVTGVPVSVACGIHYDNLSREGIGQVLAACQTLLERVAGQITEQAAKQEIKKGDYHNHEI